MGLDYKRHSVPMSTGNSCSPDTDKSSFKYQNVCGTKWRDSTNMMVFVSVEIDGTEDLECSEVSANEVRHLGLLSTEEPIGEGADSKAVRPSILDWRNGSPCLLV